MLKAFAVTADRERQMAVWEQVSAQPYRPSAPQVKRLLTEERVPGGTAIARFVGVDAYEAAGGTVMRDLFADEYEHGVWFEDPVLLEKLATQKLQVAADELATRWKWATAMIEVAWDDTARYGRVEPQPGTPTDEEKAEIEKLETRYDELRGLDDDEWTEALVEEAGRIEARLDEIEGAVEARAVFRREDFAMAGCIVTIGRDGALQVIQGLVKPEDMPKPAESGEPAPRPATAMTPTPLPTASRPPVMAFTPPARPSRRRWRRRRTARPRRARRPASASALPTICARSAPRSSRRISPATSRPPSTSCCSRWAARCSRRATTTTPSTSRSRRPRTGPTSA